MCSFYFIFFEESLDQTDLNEEIRRSSRELTPTAHILAKIYFILFITLVTRTNAKKKKKNLVQQKPVSMSFKLQCHTTQIFGASLFAKVLASFRTSVYSFKNNSRSEKWNGCCVSPLSHQAARPCSVFLFFRKDSWVITNKVSCSYNEK